MMNISLSGIIRLIIYDLLFGLFAVFVEPHILPELRNYSNYAYNRSTLWIGLLILSALAVEVPGVYFKFKAIGNRMLKDGIGKPGTIITLKGAFLLIILHAGIGVTVMLSAFRAFGLSFYHDENLFGLFFFTALIREGFIIYFVFTARIPFAQIKSYSLKNTISDVCLFFFSIIAFTATWRVIPESVKTVTVDSISELVLIVFFTSILFLIYYLSSNMTSVYENFVTARTRKQFLYRLGSLLLVTACVLYPMFSLVMPENRNTPGQINSELKEKIKAEEELYKQSLKK